MNAAHRETARELPESARARLSATPLTDAFRVRRPTHWGGRGEMLTEPKAAWQALLDRPRAGKSVAYIHVPFCANRCLFCGFYRHPAAGPFAAPYAAALARDLAIDCGRAALTASPIHAVYFGGGTPTALPATELRDAIRAARDCLPLAADCEITIEGRVFDFDLAKAEACCAAGANRFSLGVQTFDTKLRRRLGRRASREEATALLAGLVRLDQAAVVCDLIFGLPGQTEAMWAADLETVIDLGLDGVDLYALLMFPGSPLAASVAKGALPEPATLAEQAGLYAAGLAALETNGWRHLTQAHWARTTRERNLYNQLSKTDAHCLAFGAGAGGVLHGHRYMLEGDEAAWRARLTQSERPIAAILSPVADAPLRAAIQSTLDTGWIAPARLAAVAAPGFTDRLAPALDHWVEAGLVERAHGGARLTTAGWFWQTNLMHALHELAPQPATASPRAGRSVTEARA